MRDEKIVTAYENLIPDDDINARILDKIMQKQQSKKPKFKTIGLFAAVATIAAVICFVLFGSMIFGTYHGNNFTIEAYAMDEDDDQLPMRPIDIGEGMNAPYMGFGWFKIQDDKIDYIIDVGWKVTGENIKKAELTVDSGYFEKKLGGYDFGKIENGVTGMTLEKIGNSVTLSNEDIKNDMLFWGCEEPITYVEKEINATIYDGRTGETQSDTTTDIVPQYGHPSLDNFVIHATVTFNNDETEEKDVVFDLGNLKGYCNIDSVLPRSVTPPPPGTK